ncbi:MAG: polyprenyl synthetase family protein [Pseudomonadota bacterium]|nr:polyprenyl synthetase family protein [Pseudomonadota bacterium]
MSVVIDLNRKRQERPSPSIETLTKLTQSDIQQVNQTIINRMESPVILIPQVAGHIIGAGGKRLRPMLTLASARMCGYQGNRHIGLAACVEFIHTATLLHDDVVDESDLRRGAASANALWGNKSSVLVGDFLFSRGFELMVQDGDLNVLRILSQASSIIAEGEVLQLVTANDTQTTEDNYLEVIQSKTAKLFAAACEIGAVVADRPQAEWKALHAFGHNIGMAFQLVDDVLDYSARQATLGKSVGDDFRDGKITLPVVLAFNVGNEEEKGFWRRTLEDLEQQKGDFRRAVAMLERTGALAKTIERARDYGRKACQTLETFPESKIKSALFEAVEFAIGRNY